jgi:HAD superfamily hydrolase (TIGR01662 family)
MRKPDIGMALQAKKIFPEIDFSKSIMVGDSSSDMEFAKRAGMKTVFVGTKEDPGTKVDVRIATLEELLK